MQAERACFLSGKTFITLKKEDTHPNEKLSNIYNGNYFAYKYLQFLENEKSFIIKTKSISGGHIEIRLDNPSGTLLGTCAINASEKPYSITSCDRIKERGKHALYLLFGEKTTKPCLMSIGFISSRQCNIEEIY